MKAALCSAGMGFGLSHGARAWPEGVGEQGEHGCTSQLAAHLPLFLAELVFTGKSQICQTGCLAESDSIP